MTYALSAEHTVNIGVIVKAIVKELKIRHKGKLFKQHVCRYVIGLNQQKLV